MFARLNEAHIKMINAIKKMNCFAIIREMGDGKPMEAFVTEDRNEGLTWKGEHIAISAKCNTQKLQEAREGDSIILVYDTFNCIGYARLVIAQPSDEEVKLLDTFLNGFLNESNGTLYLPQVRLATVNLIVH